MIDTRFDVQRAILYESPAPDPCSVEHYIPLREALERRLIRPETHVLVASVGGQSLVLPTLEMVYYHVAQGQIEGVDWVASFCALCNAGGIFNAAVEGRVYHFAAQGLYDAMTLMADQETRSFWNHVTGACLYGTLAGAQLPRLGSLLQMTAAAAYAASPQALFTVMDRLSERQKHWAEEGNTVYRLAPEYDFDDELRANSRPLDERLPRFDMGLGLWTDTTRRYYPVTVLYQHHNALIDVVDGRSVVVVFDVDVGLPIAFYWEAHQLEFHGDTLILGPQTHYRKGVLYHNGQPMLLERPSQNTIRWYGFSSLFPGCEIYGQAQS